MIYGLDMLERADPAAIAQFLPELLHHHSAEVRRVAFARVEHLQLRSAAQAVQNAIATETEPQVRAAAFQALATLVAPHALAQLVDRLSDPDQQIQRGVLVGLLRYGGDKERQLAQNHLLRLATSSNSTERILAAQILAELGTPGFGDQALGLLVDQNAEVRREALKMAAKLRDLQLWPAVIQASATHGTTRLAVWALAAGHETALPAIEAALARPALPQRQFIALVNACGRIRGERVVQLLANELSHPDNDVRTAILEALSASGFRAAMGESVRAQIRTEAAQAAWIAAALVDLGEDEDDREHLLNYLDETDVFGEMALLDAEPRVASVTAVEPTHLLRLDQAPFYELIVDRPEVAIGLIRVLTRRLRARVHDVTDR